MAWLERDVRTGNYKVGFRVGNRKVKNRSRPPAASKPSSSSASLNRRCGRSNADGRLCPPAWDLGEFLLSGGRLAGPLQLPDKLLLSDLFQAKYPKAIEKPPFQTWKVIEEQIARGGPLVRSSPAGSSRR